MGGKPFDPNLLTRADCNTDERDRGRKRKTEREKSVGIDRETSDHVAPVREKERKRESTHLDSRELSSSSSSDPVNGPDILLISIL